MTLKQRRPIARLRQRVDDLWERALLRGNLAALSFLFVGAIVIVVSGAIVLAVTGIDVKAEDDGFLHAIWEVLLRAMSPDQLTGQETWSARLVLLVVTLFGLLMFSTLVSISNSSLSQRFERVRRGRRPVSLEGHVAILNWNEFGFRVLREISEANLVAADPHHVAILCDQDPLELMRAIEANFRDHINLGGHDTKWSREPDDWITIRRGLGHHTADLMNLAAVVEASGAIVLHEEDTDDSQVVRCVLAIGATLRSRGQNCSRLTTLLPVVTFNSNSELAHTLDRRLTTISTSLRMKDYRHINYIPLSPDEIRVGIETQVARHRGLSYVYQDLLDFGGEELYILDPPHGLNTFGQAVTALSGGIPLATIVNGSVNLWPEWTEDLTNSSVCVLASDRQSASTRSNGHSDLLLQGPRGPGRPPVSEAETFLFVGWNESAEQLRAALPRVSAPGSRLKVLLRSHEQAPPNSQFGTSQIEVSRRDKTDPLDDPSFLDDVNHVVVFADSTVSSQQSDAQALTDLLACRHYADHITESTRRFTIVGELRRRSSRHVAGLRLADDLLVSESLMAAAATQLVFEPRLEGVITALLSNHDPVEVISAPLGDVSDFKEIRWDALRMDLAKKTGEIAIGLRVVRNGDPVVLLNPPSATVVHANDEVVMLSKYSSSS